MKQLLPVLGLLGANLLASQAVWLAFISFLFQDDLILAASAAVLALPAVALQPWFLVFSLLPGGVYVAPFPTTVVTVVVYDWLNGHGELEAFKRFLLKFKTQRTIVVMSTLLLLSGSVAAARFVDFPALNRGVPSQLESLKLNVTVSRYYSLSNFIDSAWVWQAQVPEAELVRLADKLRLKSVDQEEIPKQFHRMRPYWWQPSLTEHTRAFSTPNFPLNERGPDGWHAIATWNPQDQMLHMWFKSNF